MRKIIELYRLAAMVIRVRMEAYLIHCLTDAIRRGANDEQFKRLIVNLQRDAYQIQKQRHDSQHD
jgi:hypothetical protein